MNIASITIYPVKSTKGIALDSAEVGLEGLRHDRRWAVVDPEGKRLRAERNNRLLTVTASPDDRGVTLSAEDRTPVAVPFPVGGPPIEVDITRFPLAVDAGDEAAEWFSEHLGRTARLVWQDDPAKRPMSAGHGGLDGEPLTFADTGPLLLTSTTSLQRLNQWIGDEDMVMRRFRPNVVVDGIEEAFAEDRWRSFSLGGVPFRFGECCDRCTITTIDPDSLHHGKEPIRALAQHRKWEGKTWFGIRVVPLATGTISIGDGVSVKKSV